MLPGWFTIAVGLLIFASGALAAPDGNLTTSNINQAHPQAPPRTRRAHTMANAEASGSAAPPGPAGPGSPSSHTRPQQLPPLVIPPADVRHTHATHSAGHQQPQLPPLPTDEGGQNNFRPLSDMIDGNGMPLHLGQHHAGTGFIRNEAVDDLTVASPAAPIGRGRSTRGRPGGRVQKSTAGRGGARTTPPNQQQAPRGQQQQRGQRRPPRRQPPKKQTRQEDTDTAGQ